MLLFGLPILLLLSANLQSLPNLFFFSVSENNGASSSSTTTTSSDQAEGARQHHVELYRYFPHDLTSKTGALQSKLASWANWVDFATNSNLMRLADTHLVSRHEIVPIDVAHRQGLLHRGLWIAVLRRTTTGGIVSENESVLGHLNDSSAQYKVLLLERSQTVKTCPGAWGLVGEHNEVGETWKETAIRALSEELKLTLVSSEEQVVNILPGYSILVRTDYPDMGRRELQATALFAVILNEEQIMQLKPDDEVASIQWAAIHDLYEARKREYCNPDISALAAMVGRRLNELGYT